MFGIRPTGMRSFELKVEIPSDWEFARLKHIRAFGTDFDVEAERKANGKMQITVREQGGKVQTFNVKAGTLINVKL